MIRVFLAASALVCLAVSAQSQSQEAATYGKALLQCYSSEGDKLACIGRAAEACMAREVDGDTTVGVVRCTAAETEIWDEQLNGEYKITRGFYAAMDSEDDGRRVDALLQAQRAWIAFRDAECAMEYASWGNGSIRSIAGAGCLMSLTAERTMRLVELRELMN